MVWDMSRDVAGPLLVMGQLPDTTSPYDPSATTRATSPRYRAAPRFEDEDCGIREKSIISDFSRDEIPVWVFMNIPPNYSLLNLPVPSDSTLTSPWDSKGHTVGCSGHTAKGL